MPDDDLPNDLTFTDPAVTTRPSTLPLSSDAKPEPSSTPLQKIRDLLIGLFLLAAFFFALYGLSRLILSHR